jgi:nucleotide-binding universal stress UspA family protein
MGAPIVVGYDGTEGAKAALAEALRLAGPLDAEVVLAFAYWATPLGGENADLLSALRERGSQILGEAVEGARAAGVQARGEIVNSMPDTMLAGVAAEEGAQMIVVGSYGERPLKALLVGSTPHKLMHLTEVPVLVVRGEEARGR